MTSDNPETKSDAPRRWLTKPRRTYRLNMTGPQFKRDDPEEERFANKLKPRRTKDDILEDHAKLVTEMDALEGDEHEPARPKKIDDQDRPTRDKLVGLL